MTSKFRKATNNWFFWFLVFGLGFSVWGKTDRSGERNSLKILSYNIKHGRGMDGKVDLPRIAKVIGSLSPDLVTLQEVDKNCTRSGSIDLTRELAGILKMEGRFGKFMDFQGGEYGMAVLSRFPILSHQVHAPAPRGGTTMRAGSAYQSGTTLGRDSFVRHSSRLDSGEPEGFSVRISPAKDRRGNGSRGLGR